MKYPHILAAISLICYSTLAVQTCEDNDHRVSALNFPYWKTDDTFPCMYAGTIKTSLKAEQDHNLFYWLFKNTKLDNPNLVIWLDGGPGSTSL